MNILNKLYYKPVGKIIHERENKIKEDSDKLESLTKGIEEKTQLIENILSDSKRESIRLREELIKKGETVRDQIVLDAREKSKLLFEEKMNELDKEINKAETKLTKEINIFSNRIKKTFL